MTEALAAVLEALPRVALAVSGGVDSMTLAHFAQRRLGPGRTAVYHAVSPAVPPEATARVHEHARRFGWDVHIVDAGEFDNPAYRSNPLNRCYFCKGHLYAAIAVHGEAIIASGTNRDDLGDFRPGLQAAAEHGVRHPFVEAGLAKPAVRALARALGLYDLAELPASPCLASRIETGLAVDASALALVHAVETLLRDALRPAVVRCRVRPAGVEIELDPAALERLAAAAPVRAALNAVLRARGVAALPRLAPYRRGSAFIQPEA